MTWYTGTCGRTTISLLYGLNPMVIEVTFMIWWALDRMTAFGIDAPFTNEHHGYSFASSVGHPSSDSVGLLVYDVTRIYPGHRCCIIGPSGQRQLCQKVVNKLGKPYKRQLWLIYIYIYIYILRIKILGFVIRIMHQQTLQTKLLLLGIIMEAINLNLWKSLFVVLELFMPLKGLLDNQFRNDLLTKS